MGLTMQVTTPPLTMQNTMPLITLVQSNTERGLPCLTTQSHMSLWLKDNLPAADFPRDQRHSEPGLSPLSEGSRILVW